MSEAEDELAWQMHAIGLDPIRQFHFGESIGRRWAADFAFLDKKLLIEVDGGAYVAGRHVRGQGYEDDHARDAEALCLGFRILRVTPRQVTDGKALSWIERLMK
jgi:very-short-patch-repair endonuclease